MSALARVLLLAGLAAAAPSCGFTIGPCELPAQDIGGGCPKSFDGTEADLPRCDAKQGVVAARSCGALIELTAGAFLPGRSCVYDVDTHRLVGARISPEVITACGLVEQKWGRQVDPACRDAPPTVTRDCGAARDAGGSG